MKSIFNNQKGVTLLEGLIAMGLLAMVAAGTFGVLLSVSHKASQPDIREEMVLAVEEANDWLQAYSQNMEDNGLGNKNTVRLCSSDGLSDPLANGEHNISCLLPFICDRNQGSQFSYYVYDDVQTFDFSDNAYVVADNFQGESAQASVPQRKIRFNITCNGFSL